MKDNRDPLVEKSCKEAHRGASGFSLDEIMVVVVLLMIGLFSVGTTSVMSGQMGNVTRNRMAAVNFARMEMETLLTYDYADERLDLGTTTISQPGYSGRYRVSVADTALKQLNVEIDYISFGGKMKQIELEGVMSRALH